MDIIQLSFEELEEIVQGIRTINQSLQETLSALTSTVHQLDQNWEGETHESFVSKYIALSPQFDVYNQVVESYASHLDHILNQYRMTEQNLNMNISEF